MRSEHAHPKNWFWDYPVENCPHDYTHEHRQLAIALWRGRIGHPMVCGLCGSVVRHVRLGRSFFSLRSYSLGGYPRAIRRAWADHVATVVIADLHADTADVLHYPYPPECCDAPTIVSIGGCDAVCSTCAELWCLTYEMTFTVEPYWVCDDEDLPRSNYYELPEPSKSAANVFTRLAAEEAANEAAERQRLREMWSLLDALS
jgi:hypothetical protein